MFWVLSSNCCTRKELPNEGWMLSSSALFIVFMYAINYIDTVELCAVFTNICAKLPYYTINWYFNDKITHIVANAQVVVSFEI